MKRVCVMIWAFLVLMPSYVFGGALPDGSNEMARDALEQLAEKKFSEGKASEAVEVYRQYEKVLISEGVDPLAPDLLHNQAVAYYRAGALGSAMACMKQLNLIEQSRDVADDIDDLQRLIEHRVYQKRPNTQFVRGLPDGYLAWAQSHQFSKAELHCWLIALWTMFFISLGCMISLRGRRSAFRAMLGVSVLLFGLTLGMVIFVSNYHATDSMRFGVLTGVDTLRLEPDLEAPAITDAGYVPGMTVREISVLPEWVKVEFSDGKRLWASTSEYYKLRGVGDGLEEAAQP